MRAWLIRFVTLYVFDVAVLLLIGLIMPQVSVGWSVLWAAVVLQDPGQHLHLKNMRVWV